MPNGTSAVAGRRREDVRQRVVNRTGVVAPHGRSAALRFTVASSRVVIIVGAPPRVSAGIASDGRSGGRTRISMPRTDGDGERISVETRHLCAVRA